MNLRFPRRSVRRTAVVLLASALAARSMLAQAASSDSTPSRFRVMPGFGLRAGTPQKASAALGVVIGSEWRSNGRDRSRNVAVFVEPGLSAGRGSIGFVSEFGNLGSGGGIAASVLRTWRDPWGGIADNQTYVGADLFIWPVFFLGPRIGAFRPVTGPKTRGWFIVADFGIGL